MVALWSAGTYDIGVGLSVRVQADETVNVLQLHLELCQSGSHASIVADAARLGGADLCKSQTHAPSGLCTAAAPPLDSGVTVAPGGRNRDCRWRMVGHTAGHDC